jgi:Ca-activated chloride channel family protein
MTADREPSSWLPEPPPPSDAARERALAAALRRFDEKNFEDRQGSGRGARLMERTDHDVRTPKRSSMVRARLALAASLTLVVAGSAALMIPVLTRHPTAPGHVTVAGRQDSAPSAAAGAPPAPGAESPAVERPPDAVASRAAPDAARPAPPAAKVRTFAAPAPPAPGMRAQERVPATPEPVGRDQFDAHAENPFRVAKEDPVSTFSIGVDTASYSFMRASLARNVLPPQAAVRTEEFINYFPYEYPAPESASRPFRATVSVFPSPWAPGRKLLHIGIKGYEVRPAERPRANLVFLIDTSGSMEAPNRLPLVKRSLAMLVDALDPRDTVAIVTYAGTAGVALDPTPVSDKRRILSVIEQLDAAGSTAGGEGIRQAYALAEQHFDRSGVNRVILATDGDFNVGITSREELKGFVARKRETGIYLSVLGFGMGNYNDALMQELARNGNGVAAYIDTLAEARKVLVDEATSTIVPIAKDVKIQVEFNPAAVAEYRLIGYESRVLRREDFNNDRVDAGEVGSGHAVTALYEIVPVGGPQLSDDLRYGPAQAPAGPAAELAFVKIRYKLPNSETSELITTPVEAGAAYERFEDAPREARFATAVAAFGEILRGGRYTGSFGYDDVLRITAPARGDDPFGYRAEFLQLVRSAKTAAAMQSLPRR